MELISTPLAALMRLCHSMIGNYALAIILFTLITKLILLPVSAWVHRNGVRMVALTPELNRIKIDHFGDADAIADAQQTLYKRENYHPLASTIPLFVQLILLVGVIGAVRTVLGDAQSALTLIPSEAGGATLLMPFAAGVSALVLGLAQNHLNPLQREQSTGSQWATNGVSIGISLMLGAFVPLGVGVYWIASNLLTIAQQALLNRIIPPKKYIDYVALKESKRELASMNQLGSSISKEDRARERADYKRFFSIANKHLVFYSESNGFYKYFESVIEYLLAHSNIIIHYVTSDPKDQIFEKAKSEPRIRSYYIGEKRLITLMMKMDADMVVMTMPDLENFHIKRSYVRKDVEYVYMFHGVISSMRTLRPKALDHFDTLLTVGDYIEQEVRRIEEETQSKKKKLVPCGYGVVDKMAAAYERMQTEGAKRERPIVLVAPSWQPDNILEICLLPLGKALIDKGYDVVVRPHPQYLKRFPQRFEEIAKVCNAFPGEHFRIERDFSSNETVFTADLLVTDWSSIGYEYTLATKKPVLFINTPMKVVNPECENWDSFDLKMRNVMGIALEPGETGERAAQAAERLMMEQARYAEAIESVRREHIYHFGESGKYGAKYILESLQARAKP